MDLERFQTGSLLHWVCLGVCLAAFLAVALSARWLRSLPSRGRARFRTAIVVGCLGSWLVTILFGLDPRVFRWDFSLPLQFCNLANLFGAVAVGRQGRLSQAILYFWSIVLCSWAFLTPVLYVGPAHLWFWIFWIYHLFIPIALAWVLLVDGFRPNWLDLRNSLAVTLGFLIILSILNAITGWNYGFLGPGKPGAATPLDLLGPYPLRIVWMTLIGSLFFLLVLLPWVVRRPKSSVDS